MESEHRVVSLVQAPFPKMQPTEATSVVAASDRIAVGALDQGGKTKSKQIETYHIAPVHSDSRIWKVPVVVPSCHEASQQKMSGHCCKGCGVTDTPQWRNGPHGPRTLCNACGIRLHRQLQRNKRVRGVAPKPRKKPVKVSTPVCGDDSFHGTPQTPKAVQKEVKVYADSPRLDRKSTAEPGFDDFACEERRPKRKAALVSMESTREIARDLKKSRSPRIPSERIPTPKAAWVVAPPRTPSLPNSMEAVDFTGAVDLMCLSRSGSGELTPHQGDGDRKSGGGAKMEQLGQDLLCHLNQIPDNIMRDLRGIEGELLSAHWDMQASEAAMKAVAEVLVERTEDTNKKRARYWEARSKLEEFILINLSKE